MQIRNRKNVTAWLDNGDTAAFTATIKGGKLSDLPGGDKEWSIYFEIFGFLKATVKELRDYCAGGQSGRVIMAKTLRDNVTSIEVMDRIAAQGCRIHYTDLANPNAFLTLNDRAAQLARYLASRPPDEREQALKDLEAMLEQ